MSTLDARSSAAASDRESAPRLRAPSPFAARRLALEVRWIWSRRAASRSLALECSSDVEIALSLSVRGLAESGPGEIAVEAVADCVLHHAGKSIDSTAPTACHRRLRGTWLETAGFIHLDLRDDLGIFLRGSLSKEDAGARAVWSRLPDELSIAGGCLSAPIVDVREDDGAWPPTGASAANGHHRH